MNAIKGHKVEQLTKAQVCPIYTRSSDGQGIEPGSFLSPSFPLVGEDSFISHLQLKGSGEIGMDVCSLPRQGPQKQLDSFPLSCTHSWACLVGG